MRKWQQGLEKFAKVPYSKIKPEARGPVMKAHLALGYLLTNGFACLDGYAKIEIQNMIKSLAETKIEYTMRVIQNYGKNFTPETGQYPTFHYEFFLPWFEDDRE